MSRLPVASAAHPAAQCTRAGAPLRLGQIGSFSGVTAALTDGARTALAAWAQTVNAVGGIACHPVKLFTADDGSDPARGAALVQQFASEGVQALVGVFTPLSLAGIISGVQTAKLPVVGGDGIDFAWNANPWLYPAGTGIRGVIRGGIRQAVGAGRNRIGLLYCVEAGVCTDSAKVIPEEARTLGAEVAYSAPVSLTQPDFTAQCQNAKTAGVQAFAMAVDGATIGRVARSCAALGYRPELITNGMALSPEGAADPDVRRDTLASASAVAPWIGEDTLGQREFHAALRTWAPTTTPDAAAITGWAAGKLLESVIAAVGPTASPAPVTTAELLQGLGGIHRETLGGLVPPITFARGQTAAPFLDCAFFELLTDQGWTAPKGSRPVCD